MRSFATQLHGAAADTRGVNRQAAEDAKRSEPEVELDELAHAVVMAALEVHQILGPGYLESVYEEALSVELALRGVVFERQVPVALSYKGVPIGHGRLDLLVADRLIVELKAVEGPQPIHLAQLLSYLKATRRRLGLLINFNVRWLRQGIRRVIHSG